MRLKISALVLNFRAVLLVLCGLGALSDLSAYAPQHVIFTWQGDTGTTLTVNYQTFGDRKLPSTVYYDTQPRDGRIAEYRYKAEGSSFQIDGVPDRWVHRVELTGLTPGATIWLMAGDYKLGTSREFKVKTIPHDDRPLRFIIGGDIDANHGAREILKEAAKFSPDFVVIGGDIAYADGLVSNIGKWDSWFTYWNDEMVTPEGYDIPIVAAIGNHEVRGGYRGTPADAPFYFAYFAQHPDSLSYFVHQFGANMVLLTLDSGHVEPHDGRQKEWLEKTLQEYAHIPYRIAQYHVPLYPSTRDFEGEWSKAGREHWLPLFDKYELTVGFEHHDHAYKRTHLLRNNEIVEEGGTLYLGDGSWGRERRPITKGGRWYLKQSAQVLHFWVVEVEREGLTYRAIDEFGRAFDVYPTDTRGAENAAALFSSIRSTYTMPKGVAKGWMLDEETVSKDFPTILELNNVFDAPMTVELSYHSGPVNAQAEGLPAKVRIEPGERVEFPFTVHLENEQVPYETRYWIETVVKVDQSGGVPDVYGMHVTIQTAERAKHY